VEIELIFDFRDEKKPLRYIEDFFSSQKLEEQLKIRFRSREGVCLASLAKAKVFLVSAALACNELYLPLAKSSFPL
jgi:hypothetical protein